MTAVCGGRQRKMDIRSPAPASYGDDDVYSNLRRRFRSVGELYGQPDAGDGENLGENGGDVQGPHIAEGGPNLFDAHAVDIQVVSQPDDRSTNTGSGNAPSPAPAAAAPPPPPPEN